jgi:hypothetical protein
MGTRRQLKLDDPRGNEEETKCRRILKVSVTGNQTLRNKYRGRNRDISGPEGE